MLARVTFLFNFGIDGTVQEECTKWIEDYGTVQEECTKWIEDYLVLGAEDGRCTILTNMLLLKIHIRIHSQMYL